MNDTEPVHSSATSPPRVGIGAKEGQELVQGAAGAFIAGAREGISAGQRR